MSTEPIEPQRTPRHPHSARGVGLRVLLFGAMLTSLAFGVTGDQPAGALSADGREPASDSAILANGEPMGGSQGTSGEPSGDMSIGQAGDGAPVGGDGPAGRIAPVVRASPGSPSGGSAGGPPDDWHLYHRWTDPSWPDAGQATGEQPAPDGDQPGGGAPLPARTAGGYNWEPPVTPTTDPLPPTGWTPTPDYPTDPAPGTPTTTGPAPDPTTTAPAPDPTGDEEQPDTSPDTPGQDGASPQATTGDPLGRDPVAAGRDDDDLGLGETVDEPTPTPAPTDSAGTAPLRAGAAPHRAADPGTTPASEHHQTLIYSGLVGLALAAIGLTMVGLRRRRW